MDLGLSGKVIAITGGTDGLGLALARTLVAEGAAVAVCGRDQPRLDAAVDELRTAGGDALGVRVDVAEPAGAEQFIGAVAGRWSRLDGLVNNAGRSAGKPVARITDEDWDADLHLKVYAASRMVRQALPLLSVQGGSIINVLATSAKAPAANSAPSSVSRAAGMALTKALSREVGGTGVRVNAVLIGLVESGQWVRRAAREGLDLKELYESMASEAHIPLGRVGRADEFADLAAYLLSPRSSYVTGTAINLDGGLSAVV